MSIDNIKRSSLVVSTGIVSAGTAFSRVLGLVREQVMAYYFGASAVTDVFVAAFRIPNLLRDLFAEGALSSAFVPVFKEKLVNESEEAAFGLARIVTTAMLVVIGAVVLLGIVATPFIMYISAFGFTADPDKFDLAVKLTQIMWPFLLLVSLAALIMGILNSFGRFGIPAVAPAIFNLGSVLCVVLMYHWFDVPIYTMAIGVLVGGVGQLAIQLPPLWRIGFRYRWSLNFLDESFRKVLKLFFPMMIGLSASRINILVSTLLASFLMEGSLSFLNYSFRLMHFPLGVFAVALGTVSLPNASELAARRDMKRLSSAFSDAMSLNMFLVVPSAAFLALMGRELVDVVYRWGAFSETNSANTALALLHYSYGLVGFAAVRVIVPIYYALKDASLPMKVSISSVLLNIALYYPLIKMLDFAGVAAATSIAGLVNFAVLLYFLPRRHVHVAFGPMLLGFVRVSVAATLAFWAASLIPVAIPASWSDGIGRLFQFGVRLTAGGLLYLGLCLVLKVGEVRLIFNRLRGHS